jgi:hypothetical protein
MDITTSLNYNLFVTSNFLFIGFLYLEFFGGDLEAKLDLARFY